MAGEPKSFSSSAAEEFQIVIKDLVGMPFHMSPSVGCRNQVHVEAPWFTCSSTNKWIDKLVRYKTTVM